MNIGTVLKADRGTLGVLLRDGMESYVGFSERIDTILD